MDLEFPVATCRNCGVRGPVYITEVPASLIEDIDPDAMLKVVICGECEYVLNDYNDLEIEWFSVDDAKYFGYKVVNNE